MTREEAKKYLPIIKAFSEGKTIEYRISILKSAWTEMKAFPNSTFDLFEFRIKPESKWNL